MATTQSNGAKPGLLEKLLHEQLRDIYYAEKAIEKALPKMQKEATTPELKNAFQEHLVVTKGQIQRLEQVFEHLGHKASGKKCPAIEGLVTEAEEVIESTKDDTMTRDVGLIVAAQKVEHYEIASYGSLRTIAETLGHRQAASLLQQTLDEEKETDELLTQIAVTCVNNAATAEKKGR